MIDFTINLLTALEVVVALLLIGIILIQQSKSGGGLGAVGGAMTETFLGASAGNVLTKATVILAACFLGITLFLAILTGHREPGRSVVESVNETTAAERQPADVQSGKTGPENTTEAQSKDEGNSPDTDAPSQAVE